MKKSNSSPIIIKLIAIFIVALCTTGAAAVDIKSTAKPATIKEQAKPQLPLADSIANLTDPTRPPDELISPEKALVASGPLELTAIFYNRDRQRAIINDKTVEPGDVVGEYTVINIHRDTVELIGSDGKKLTLNLTIQVKKPSKIKGI